MSSIKNRVKKLEAPAGTRGSWRDFIEGKLKVDPAEWAAFCDRGMSTLAAALTDITGQPVTKDEAAQALEDLNHEQPTKQS